MGEMIYGLVDDLKRDEGFVPHAYEDSEGFLTIGYGRLIDERRSGGITEAEARYLLENDISETLKELDRAFPWWRAMTDGRQRALANMAFNLGLSRLKGFKNMLAALEIGDYEAAAAEALDSRWAKQVGKRADRIAALFRGEEA